MTKQTLTLASLALLAQAAPASDTNTVNTVENSRHQLNTASATAIQESWIKVSPACKDRSFPFHPVKVTAEITSQQVQRLFAELDQTVGQG